MVKTKLGPNQPKAALFVFSYLIIRFIYQIFLVFQMRLEDHELLLNCIPLDIGFSQKILAKI